ncbi:MAG: hypothetical protein U0174_22435 [Polyangiaceae bacterium]
MGRSRLAAKFLALGSVVVSSSSLLAAGCGHDSDATTVTTVAHALASERQWSAWAATVPTTTFGPYLGSYDRDRKTFFAFGGVEATFNDQPVPIDAWEYTTSWGMTVPPDRPLMRIGAVAYDPVRKKHLALGTDQSHWEYDPSLRRWTQLFPAGYVPSVPSPDFNSAAPFVFEASKSTAYFAGDTGLSIWNGSSWAAAGVLPDNRSLGSGFRLTWDEKRSRLLGFAAGGGRPARVFAFSPQSSTWAQVGADLSERWSYSSVGATYDVLADAVRTVGYPASPGAGAPMETWSLSLTSGQWTRIAQVSPPDTYVNAAFDLRYDYGAQVPLLMARSTPGAYRYYTLDVGADTWRLDVSRSGAVALPVGYAIAVMSDVAGNRLLRLAPATYNTSSPLEVWAFDGTGFTHLTPNNAAPVVSGNGGYIDATFDSDRRRVVATLTEGGFRTWEFDVVGRTWSLGSSTAPSSGSAPLTYDASLKKVVRYDGTNGWLWNGSAWSAVAGAQPPTRGQGTGAGSLVYDAANQRTILWGGANRNDTWALTAAGWQELTAPTAPPPFGQSTMTFDPVVQRVVLLPAAKTAPALWERDAARWQSASVGPSIASGAFAAYLSSRRSISLVPSTPVSYAGGAPSNITIWFADALASSCQTDADCGSSLFCTDGICCGRKACDTCETCNGLSPGKCTAIANAEDPGSCDATTQSICNAKSVCAKANGAPASSAAECGSGFLANGVCCNELCDGLCQACTAALKTSGDRTGVCGAAKDGVADSQQRCAADPRATCRQDGLCDGRGACRLYAPGTACGTVTCTDNRATGNICNGLGSCVVSATGQTCGGYACGTDLGCPTSCDDDRGCVSTHRCENHACVVREGSHCDGNVVVDSAGQRTDCGAYKCIGGACPTSCTDYRTCKDGFVCTASGRTCVPPGDSPTDGLEGCAVGAGRSGPPSSGTRWAFALASALLLHRRRVSREGQDEGGAR